MGIGIMLIPLANFDFYREDPVYREIYSLYEYYGRLPPPDQVYISVEPLNRDIPENVVGQAGIVGGRRVIWFRKIPPPYNTFSHELFHIADKKVRLKVSPEDLKNEEAGAEIISALIVYLALNNKRYDAVKLLEEPPTLEDILHAMRKATNIQFRDILEYYRVRGSIPIFVEFRGGEWRLKKSYSQEDLVYYILFDLVDAALTYPAYDGNIEWKILENLLTRYQQRNMGFSY